MREAKGPSIYSEDRTALLLERAEAAVFEKDSDEARRLFKAALRQDPTNDQALIWLIYLAEDGQASLNYLSRLLDAHPQHPEATEVIRWARKRIPTSDPRHTRLVAPTRKASTGRPHALVLGLAVLAILLGTAVLWQLGKSPVTPVQAGPSKGVFSSTDPRPTARPLMAIVKVIIPLFTPSPTPTPPATATPIPVSAWVPVVGYPQTFNLSCESRSAADLAGFWGVTINELDLLASLGLSDNPHEGFVGDATMPPGSLPPYGYGVYVEPVAATLRDFGLDARPVYDLGLDGLKSELVAGRPVLIWATYGMDLHEPLEWTSVDGRISTVVPFMHTFIVIGFDEDYVVVLDAYDATVQRYFYSTFLEAWNLFDQMALIVSGQLP